MLMLLVYVCVKFVITLIMTKLFLQLVSPWKYGNVALQLERLVAPVLKQ